MSIIVHSNQKGCIESSNLIPERSKAVKAAWIKATDLSFSPKCSDRHLLAPAYLIKATAISFFNTLSYLALALYSLVTKGICKCDFSYAGQDFKDAGKSFVSGFAGIGAMLSLIAVGIFCSKKAYEERMKLLASQTQTQTKNTETTPDQTASTTSQTTQKIEKSAEGTKEKTEEKKSANEENGLLASTKATGSIAVSKSLSSSSSSKDKKEPVSETGKKAVPSKDEPHMTDEELAALAAHMSDAELAMNLSGKIPRTELKDAHGLSAEDLALLAAFDEEEDFPSDHFDEKERKENKQNIPPKAQRLLGLDKGHQLGDFVSDADLDKVIERLSSKEEKKSHSPREEKKFAPPFSIAQPSSNQRLSRTDLLKQRFSSPAEIPPASLPPSSKNEGKRSPDKPVEAQPTSSPDAPFRNDVLHLNLWGIVGEYLDLAERRALMDLLEKSGVTKEALENLKKDLIKKHFQQKGYDIQILREEDVNGQKVYSIKVFFRNLKSRNTAKPTKDDVNPRINQYFKDLVKEIGILKEKGLLPQNGNIKVVSADCAFSDVSLRAIFGLGSTFLRELREVNLTASRMTDEAFNNLHNLTSLETIRLDFCHSEKARVNRYRAPAGVSKALPEEERKKQEKEQRTFNDYKIIDLLKKATPCPSVRRVFLRGTVVEGDWFGAITRIFPNAQEIYYTENFSEQGSQIRDRRLPSGELVTKQQAGQNPVTKVQPLVRATRQNGSWQRENVVDYGAMVHEDCGMQINPSLIESDDMFGISLEEAIDKHLECPHCAKPFTSANMKHIKDSN